MKTRLLLTMLLLSGGLVMAGCNQQKQYRPDPKIINTFKTKYPKAERIEWEPKNGYYVAEFHDNNVETEAWFDNNGQWVMTESNIKYNALPQAIRESFEKSSYNNWKKDDIDKIERAGMVPVYIIEIEKEGHDTDLYYTEDGTLVKTIQDVKKEGQTSYMPVATTIHDLILQKYPHATIIDTDFEKGKYEIDILDQGKAKEVVFRDNNWEATYWEVTKTEVPTVVMDAFRNSTYKKYRIDEIHFFETPTTSYYRFELEQGNNDIYLSIDQKGNILK